MSWTENAIAEIRRAGLYDKDSDYDGMLGESLEALVVLFGSQGHSGMSAEITARIFADLVAGKPLSPLTDDPDEWVEISSDGTKQNRRCSAVFMGPNGAVYSIESGEFTLPGYPPERKE